MNIENLTTEDIEFLKSLAYELRTQNNFCTAEPLSYKIAEPTIEWGIDSDYSYDKTSICIGEYDSENFIDIEDEEAIKEELLNYFEGKSDYEDIVKQLDGYDLDDSLEEFLNEYKIEYTYIYGREIIIYHGAFLTYKEAKMHLEANKYHYDGYGKPYVYCDCNWRNPEMERLLNIIKKFDKEEK